jgi:hypothetical protein
MSGCCVVVGVVFARLAARKSTGRGADIVPCWERNWPGELAAEVAA